MRHGKSTGRTKQNPTMAHTSASQGSPPTSQAARAIKSSAKQSRRRTSSQRKPATLRGSTSGSDAGGAPGNPREQQPGKAASIPRTNPPAMPPTRPTAAQLLRRSSAPASLDSAGLRRQSGETLAS
jgi:hypothetical protein